MQSSGASHQVPKTPSVPWFKIYPGDCLKSLQSLPEGSVDALVTDPPYTNERPSRGRSDKAVALRAANRHRDLSINGQLWLMREIALEAQRLVKPTGSLLVFCDAKSFFQMVPVIESAGLRYRNVIIWDKEHYGTGVGFRCQHELIANFCFDKPEYFDQSTGSVLVCKRVPDSARRHENQKPVSLLKKLIKVVCPPGGVVLDPFMGMGSTGLACLWTDRNFIGVELNQQHFELAETLLWTLQAQLRTQLGSR
jgi:site-specific DNA-methyltransferase (adenine-specific)